MLLQTLVQLNILILATPALAGWSLLPPVHSCTVHAVGIVWQYRAVETAAPKPETRLQVRRVQRASAALPCLVLTPVLRPAAVFAADPHAVLDPLFPFPHAARAP